MSQSNHTKKNPAKNLGFGNPQVLVFSNRFTQNKNQGFLENHDLSWFDTKFDAEVDLFDSLLSIITQNEDIDGPVGSEVVENVKCLKQLFLNGASNR